MLGLRSVEKTQKKSTVPNYMYNYITSGGPSSIMCMGRERWTVGTVGGWVGGKELQSVEELLQAGLHMRLRLVERS
jgi:hypothetical protein